MAIALVVLLLALLLGGLGFAIHVLWIVAVVALALFVLGFLMRGADRRWYHW